MRIQEKIAFTKPECSNKKQTRCLYLVSLLLVYINLFLWGKILLPEKTEVSKKPCPSLHFSDTASCERLPASSLCHANNVSRIGKKEIPKGELSKESYDF